MLLFQCKLSAAFFVVAVSIVSHAAAALDGKQLYIANCGTCHQLDGGGVPMMQPELIQIERAKNPVGGVVEMILKGSAAIEPGLSDYGNEMPAFDYLSNTEIALIASYVRSNFGNEGNAVTEADVKRLRQ
ncbi:MAG: cytochrome c [Kordiimonas sp.]